MRAKPFVLRVLDRRPFFSFAFVFASYIVLAWIAITLSSSASNHVRALGRAFEILFVLWGLVSSPLIVARIVRLFEGK